MPDLLHSLFQGDIGYLRIIASFWGVELPEAETEAITRELARCMLDPDLVREIIEALPGGSRHALEAVVMAGGKIPWATYTRRFGEIRAVGAGRRDREQIFLDPISAAEALFYRGLVVRAFFSTPSGLQEFAYIPDDLLSLIQPERNASHTEINNKISGQYIVNPGDEPLGHLASPIERSQIHQATDHLLDDAVTLLAATRIGIDPRPLTFPERVVHEYLQAAGILAGDDPNPRKVKSFLEQPRQESLSLLADAWKGSETFNELRQLPGLVFEGEWQSHPLATRRFILALLENLPVGKWWSLSTFINAVKEKHPDFQRPSGDYDSWYIKRNADGVYLRGFSTWDEVDGAVLRYIISGPLFWLGKVDLASVDPEGPVTAFLRRANPPGSQENGKLSVASTGSISVPVNVPKTTRYLVARFCEWNESRPGEYRYHVTPASLKRAASQGLKVSQLLSLLAGNSGAPIPPAFVKALKRWENKGSEVRLETQTILRLERPEVLEELRRSRAARFLAESLGPTSVVVKRGAGAKVVAALFELGLLAEDLQTEE